MLSSPDAPLAAALKASKRRRVALPPLTGALAKPPVAEEVDLHRRLARIDGGTEAADLFSKVQLDTEEVYDYSAPQVLKSAEALREMAWQRLHTGHWAEVDSAWRSCYMYASFIYARAAWEVNRRHVNPTCLRAIDLGLMLGDTSFRAKLMQAAEYFEEQLQPSTAAAQSNAGASASSDAGDESRRPLRALSGPLPTPPSIRMPSLAFFYNEHMVPSRPAILRGVLDGWPALTTRPWSDLSYLKNLAGHRTVPIEHGQHYLDEAFDERLMTLNEFITQHLEGPPPTNNGRPTAYLAQHELFTQLPRLRRDIIQPDYCMLSLEEGEEEEEAAAAAAKDDVRVNAWLGPAGTLSPLHYDRYHNLLCQVVGSKYIRLYAPDQSDSLYPHTSGPHKVSSQIVEVDDADHEKYPKFGSAPYCDLVLNAGECLYIPPLWWHFVESRSISFSVSFWWT